MSDEPQYKLDIDWEKASALGLSIADRTNDGARVFRPGAQECLLELISNQLERAYRQAQHEKALAAQKDTTQGIAQTLGEQVSALTVKINQQRTELNIQVNGI